MTERPALPLEPVEAAFDLDALRYLGPSGSDPDAALLIGPHGVTFKLEIIPNLKNWKPEDGGQMPAVYLWGLDISPIVYEDKITVSIRHRVMYARMYLQDPAALPPDHEKRTMAILGSMAKAMEPKAPKLANGTLEELNHFFTDFAILTSATFDVMSAVSDAFDDDEPYFTWHTNYTSDVTNLGTEILSWFGPVASQCDLSSKWVDAREATMIFRAVAMTPTAHDTLQAAARITEFLDRQRKIVGWSERRYRAALKTLKLGPAKK